MRKPSHVRTDVSPSQGISCLGRIGFITLFAIVAIAISAGTVAGWTYTNSTPFCGTTCHTMPPQYSTYLRSPHSRVDCVECHLGRATVDVMLPRKIEHSETLYSMIFHKYEYPIVAKKMRPANEACETCHFPRKFSTDSLREIRTHANDEVNTPISIFLLLKTGGGSKRDGLGRGIHWHIENKVTFLATDPLEQNIPYVRVENPDGSVQEFVDVDSGITAEQASQQELKNVDCITCHNRVSHAINSPEQSVDTALYTGVLSGELPFLRQRAVELLSATYASSTEATQAFAGLADYYQQSYPQVYGEKKGLVDAAVGFLKSIYLQTHFEDQKLDWQTHPDNTGHKDSPGCFRCHDGKHISASGDTIRMECNLCHSVPQNADPSQFVSSVSIVRGAEPGSHTNTFWIALHGKAIDQTCAQCHPPAAPGQDWTTLNGQKPQPDASFCGNSACHQSDWKFAGFNSAGIQPVLQDQLGKAQRLNAAP